jgi:hypothetical protein
LTCMHVIGTCGVGRTRTRRTTPRSCCWTRCSTRCQCVSQNREGEGESLRLLMALFVILLFFLLVTKNLSSEGFRC